jgi:syntaxin-binding protein 1
MKTSLVKMCQNPEIDLVDKLRLLMIYIISQGSMQESTRKELMQGISLRLQKAIRNLEKLGVDLSVQITKNKARHSKARLAEFEKRNKTIPLALMRFVPFLHSVFSNLVTNQLSDDEFPYISPPPEGVATSSRGSTVSTAKKGTRSNWRGKKKETETKEETPESDTRSRYFCFIAGGMTFSELRSAYEVVEQNSANFFLGSTSTITSKDFIRGLAELDDDDDLSDGNSLDDDRKKKKKQDDDVPTTKDERKDKKADTKNEKKQAKKKNDSDSDDDEVDQRKVKDDFNKISIKFT